MSLVIDGDARSFRAAAYGRPSERKIDFLRQQFDDPSRAMIFADQNFAQRSRQIFESNFNDEAMAIRENVRRHLSGVWETDTIRYLSTLEAFQNAKPTMQRWIMANPFVRNMYKQGRVAGYGDAYLDHVKQGVGRDHYDFQLATSGMASFDDEHGWQATTFFPELLDGDEEPTFLEKVDIFKTWCEVEHALQSGTRDPTSPENNQWG